MFGFLGRTSDRVWDYLEKLRQNEQNTYTYTETTFEPKGNKTTRTLTNLSPEKAAEIKQKMDESFRKVNELMAEVSKTFDEAFKCDFTEDK